MPTDGSLGLPKSGDTPDALLPAEPDTAAQARALHAHHELHQALDYGFALLDALDLPPLALDAIDDAIARLDALDGDADLEDDDTAEAEPDDEDGGDDEHSLGAPERHPHVLTMGTDYYEPANGSYRLVRCWESQASWAQGTRLEGEREAEAGYCLPEGDGGKHGEDDDDMLSKGEHDTADNEPWLGAVADIDQRRWAAGGGSDAEFDATDCIDRRKTVAQCEAAYARRPALRALAAHARALKQVRLCDPDAVTIIQPGVAWWAGPVLRNGVPMAGRLVSASEPNLLEIAP